MRQIKAIDFYNKHSKWYAYSSAKILRTGWSKENYLVWCTSIFLHWWVKIKLLMGFFSKKQNMIDILSAFAERIVETLNN